MGTKEIISREKKSQKIHNQRSIAGKASAAAKRLKFKDSQETSVPTEHTTKELQVTNNQNHIQNHNQNSIINLASSEKTDEDNDPVVWFDDETISFLQAQIPKIDVKMKCNDKGFKDWCINQDKANPYRVARAYFDKQQHKFESEKSLGATINESKRIEPSVNLLHTKIFKRR